MADVALGTVSLVLQVVRHEARLLGSVRDDVQFILDELESMTGLLRHLVVNCRARAANDLQVRVWMKQILDFALDCRNCVKQYSQLGGGSEGDERRVRWWSHLLPHAVASRHQIATEIRKLKARAREIGERQQRYGVAVPNQMSSDSNGGLAQASSSSVVVANSRRKHGLGTLQDVVAKAAFRQAVLSGPGILTDLVQWIQHLPSEAESSAAAGVDQPPRLTVVAVLASYSAVGDTLIDQVYSYYYRQQQQSSQAGTAWFDCMLRVTVPWPSIPRSVQGEMTQLMLRELQDKSYINPQARDNGSSTGDGDAAELQNSFRGKKVLLGVSDMDDPNILPEIRDLLATLECRPGSVMLFSAKDERVAEIMQPTKTVFFSHLNFYLKRPI